jgi:hypothetical protein
VIPRLDSFSWSVIAVVVVLLAAAVVTVNLTEDRGWGQVEYLDEETPAAAVRNAYVAFLKQDFERARRYYTREVLVTTAQEYGGGVGPFDRERYVGDRNRRLRIVHVQFQGNEHAAVTFAVDHFNSGGLFKAGSTWTDRRTVPVTREGDGWKIDTQEFFY